MSVTPPPPAKLLHQRHFGNVFSYLLESRPLLMAVSWPRASGTRNFPHPILYHRPLKQKKMTGYLQGFPKNRGFHRPEPVILHTLLPSMLWVMETTSHKFGTAMEAFLKDDATTSGPSDIFYLQEGVAFPVLSPLPDAKVLEEVTPPPDTWIPWKPPGVNWVNNRVHRLCQRHCSLSYVMELSEMLLLPVL